ncbi:MAG TPA: tRNA preQ1(34) S-adenosylmethionine ribosyltransferase-isomerase QueA [Candidatus Omnitrophota bacterium]|nr:tRNA preQ1(34) S-adenosylmethionine ribosyltransferase-isomerase QueA [Candidatus Omnitrophota bacterium]HRZ15887.1 tRNA preQ1(34) S-adenosylmethionine ribosyltransferase-isomerase QueA [Candidatus Omnitrophota bacterium]
MKLSEFDYHLPRELIAQHPLLERDAARLMVVHRKENRIEHRIFRDIAGYLRSGDLLVLNNTRVVACRLRGKRATGGAVEVFLVKDKGGLVFEALISPLRVHPGERIFFKNGLSCELCANREVAFSGVTLSEIYAAGEIPLPPYIKRPLEESDAQYYQTVYARDDGSVASPTAGLHFTRELLDRLQSQGVREEYVTLHVGLATFKAVTSDSVTDHQMGKEYMDIPSGVQEAVRQIRRPPGRIVAVGTTSCRTLESFAAGMSRGYTDLFIYPGYAFQLTDALLTNFHLPKTTLFMLVCAFAGTDLARRAYQEAVDRCYRFYSYGDAMLIV